ncbi:MAG TPA: MarR family transcriptional regulator [Corynebacterium sp.]|nr:MarR family transcriptional regulator [Corynebacterium sp.]
MSTHSLIPVPLLESPSFQLERLRRRVREEVEHTLAGEKTTLREYWVLTCLTAATASSQSALSDALAIDASDMVRLIDSLEERDWAKRERDPQDRRRQIVTATRVGEKAHAKLMVLVTEAEDRALDASTNKQLKHLRKLAASILAAEKHAAGEDTK